MTHSKVIVWLNSGEHCKEDPIYEFPETKLRGLSPYFYIHTVHSICERFLCFQERSAYFAAAK